MKRLSIAAVLVFALAAIPAVAQEHFKEKKARGELEVGGKFKVGNNVLAPGKYVFACNRKDLTIQRLPDGRKLTLPCRGKELERKAQFTELYTELDNDGLRVVEKLLIRGSNVEHTF